NPPSPTHLSPLSLHDALPIYPGARSDPGGSPSRFRRACRERCAVLHRVPCSDDLSSASGGPVSIPEKRPARRRSSPCAALAADRLHSFGSLAQDLSVRVNRLALVSGDAGSNDWHYSDRLNSTSRPLHLLVRDWLVHPGGLGSDGAVQKVRAQTRNIGPCRLGHNRSVHNTQLFPRRLLAK